MASMMNASKNMELTSSGRCLLNFSNAYLLQPRSKIKFSVCMEGCRLKLILLIKLEISIGSKIYHIMVHYVIFCGLTLPMMVKMDLIHRPEGLGIAGEKMSVISSCIEII